MTAVVTPEGTAEDLLKALLRQNNHLLERINHLEKLVVVGQRSGKDTKAEIVIDEDEASVGLYLRGQIDRIVRMNSVKGFLLYVVFFSAFVGLAFVRVDFAYGR